jgi:uncharacterized protein (DUF486 family)
MASHELPLVTCNSQRAADPCYIALPQKALLSTVHLVDCECGNRFTAFLPINGHIENTTSFIVMSVSVSAEMCLLCRCLAMAACTYSTILISAIMLQYIKNFITDMVSMFTDCVWMKSELPAQ